MNQWYRKTVTKVTVLVIGILSGAIFLTSFGVVTTLAGTANPGEVMEMASEPYEESANFNQAVAGSVMQVFEQFRMKNLFETDGAYNPDKVIDIMQLADDGRVDGSNTSGVAYTLEQLESWGKNFDSGDTNSYEEDNVVVCQRGDGSYYYYYLDDFLARFERGELMIEFEEDYLSQAEFLRDLAAGSYPMAGEYAMTIYDGEGNELYTDCWNFGQSLREEYAPQGAENLLEVVNNTPELNGMLSTIYNNIASALGTVYSGSQEYQSGWDYLEEGNTNFAYIYVDEDTKQVYTNRSEYKDYVSAEKNIEDLISGDSVKYMVVYPKLEDFNTNMDLSWFSEWGTVRAYESDRNFNSIFAAAVDTTYPIHDQFYEGAQSYEANSPMLHASLVLFVLCGVLFLVCAVWLALTAGRVTGDEELHLSSFDRWKTELAAGTVIFIWGAATLMALSMGFPFIDWRNITTTVDYYVANYNAVPEYTYSLVSSVLGISDVAGLFFYGVFTFGCFFAGYVSLVRRIKAKILWKGSLLRAVVHFCSEVLRERSATFKAALVLLGLFFISWMAFLVRNIPMAFVMLLADAAAAWLVLSSAIAKSRIRKGVEEIASGNLEYQIELKGLSGTNRDMAEMVNNIGSGLNNAVDKAMRNERLKTDLITNVSHDIKTPLTSIINYVDILKRSDITDEKIRGYLDILEAKAQRLKTLTEDVVEASKVSSGNITLEYMDVDLRELVQQTEGETAEKFSARNLTVVVSLPEEPAVIHVDGRRMWRVLENIFGNAAKYAMPGTRVYADLNMTEEKVCFSLKNVSEQQLNISADELTERFIRGDISRSTEGSGLGLSIAKSLTTMQGGEFELYLDGDLFRVNIEFPRVR